MQGDVERAPADAEDSVAEGGRDPPTHIEIAIGKDPELRAFLSMPPEASDGGFDPPEPDRYRNGHRPASAPPHPPQPIGAGYVILAARELTGLSQRRLAARVGTSQSTLAKLETGNRTPTVRTLLRVAAGAGFDLVLGLRAPGSAPPDAAALAGFALLGTLHLNPQDGLADFVVLRDPSPFEGPRD